MINFYKFINDLVERTNRTQTILLKEFFQLDLDKIYVILYSDKDDILLSNIKAVAQDCKKIKIKYRFIQNT